MRILIVRNDANPEAMAASVTLGNYAASQSIAFTMLDASSIANDVQRETQRSVLDPRPAMIVVLGGDGTLLRTVHLMNPLRVPILGINFGHLGFLTNDDEAGILEIVSAALAGDVKQERRTCLNVVVECDGDDQGIQQGEPAESLALYSSVDHLLTPEVFGINRGGLSGQRQFFALNELAITRGALGRVIDFSFSVGGSAIANLQGDGIVVATATGSTAYALSAGGPLVAPSHGGLTVVPIAAHSLHSRAFVTGANDVVEVILTECGSYREATLFLDGEMLLFPTAVRRVLITADAPELTLLRYGSENFYAHAAEVFF